MYDFSDLDLVFFITGVWEDNFVQACLCLRFKQSGGVGTWPCWFWGQGQEQVVKKMEGKHVELWAQPEER